MKYRNFLLSKLSTFVAVTVEKICSRFFAGFVYFFVEKFIAFYFMHINYEEEKIQPTLWRLCTTEELANAFKLIMANQTPEELSDSLEMLLPALNPYERLNILKQGQATMPPEAFQGALHIAEKVLTFKT
jgi:hypothetical protein